MAAVPFLVLCACVLGLYHVEATPDTLSSVDSSFCQGGLHVIYPELDIDKCLIIPKDRKLREKVSTVWKAPQIYFTGADKRKLYVLVMADPDAPSNTKPTSAYWRHWLVVNIQYFAPRAGNICLASEWSLAVQIGAACVCEEKRTEIGAETRYLMPDGDFHAYLKWVLGHFTDNIFSPFSSHSRMQPSSGTGLKKAQIQGTTLTDYSAPTPPKKTGFHRYQFMLFEQPPYGPLSLTEEEKSTRGKWDLRAFVSRFDLGEPVATVQFLTQNYKD
ncbi:phosphatidylethanolamine-binding protein 4 isoform X1 [Morone saxatilis]|uniref:phosphatidylethanolamine-binding protein 4 isoform X1 n=1 Tax=Morone saxatilis TaxID=34816 RepID=UPI0015E1F99F|nr:phosphatidylethanolamine-binding protein 4 isoform X1 [Morone saxatilis]